MSSEKNKKIHNRKHRPAVALVITLVILVALSSVAYSLYARLAAQRHRNQYFIDYTAARYAADSGLKYALTFAETIKPVLIPRPNEPDFSDLFHLSEEERQQLIYEWVEALAEMAAEAEKAEDVNDINDVNDPNNFIRTQTLSISEGLADPNLIFIRGPYGPPWPLITKEMKFEMGTAEITIQIHDENAKMPISWAVITDSDLNREADAAFETFCEWMGMNLSQINELKSQTDEIAEIKEFKFTSQNRTRTTTTTTIRPRRKRTRRRTNPTPAAKVSPHIIDWARLFHSTLLDTEMLAVPTIENQDRKESALKYLGIWGSEKINVNTAPRHVLEAAFTFGGDADKIAEEIIQKRRLKPFADISNLKTRLLSYADSITKAEQFITTKSDFLTVRITARSGVAKASAIAAIIKEDKAVEKVAVIAK
jgi:hypothetical protein